jgi:transcription elongation factor Elf1
MPEGNRGTVRCANCGTTIETVSHPSDRATALLKSGATCSGCGKRRSVTITFTRNDAAPYVLFGEVGGDNGA